MNDRHKCITLSLINRVIGQSINRFTELSSTQKQIKCKSLVQMCLVTLLVFCVKFIQNYSKNSPGQTFNLESTAITDINIKLKTRFSLGLSQVTSNTTRSAGLNDQFTQTSTTLRLLSVFTPSVYKLSNSHASRGSIV